MKPGERDKLLVDMAANIGGFKESLSNIYHLTEKQERHLDKLNGHLDDHSKRLVIAETQIKERTTARVSKKVITGYSGIILVVLTLIYYLGQARGWW